MKPEEIQTRLAARLGAVELSPGPGDAALIIPAAAWHQAALALRDDPALAFDFLRSLSGVDRPPAGTIEVVAHLLSYEHRHALVVKTAVDRHAPLLATVSDVWPAADWHERELFDLFGVKIAGHPDLRRLLLPDDWEGHPLRKDYQEPPAYHGIPMRRPAAPSRLQPAFLEKP